VKLRSVTTPPKEWVIDLIFDNGQPEASIEMSISTFSMGMKLPPGIETIKIGGHTAWVSRPQGSIHLTWINDTGWELSIGSSGVTLEELVKIAESVTTPPNQVLTASLIPDTDLLILRGSPQELTLHLQNNAISEVKVQITDESKLPSGIGVTFSTGVVTLSPKHSTDIKVNVKVDTKVASPTWTHRSAAEVLPTDTPPPLGAITEPPYYTLKLKVSCRYNGASGTLYDSYNFSERLRIDPPPTLPEGMVTLKEADAAVDYPLFMLLPAYLPEGVSPPPIGCQISGEEPHTITVFYSKLQVVLSPEPGVTQPPGNISGERITIRKKQVVIGQNRIDWWVYDIHFAVISDQVPMSEMKLIAESMMLMGPGSGSWLVNGGMAVPLEIGK
jgi:hypothetical protein